MEKIKNDKDAQFYKERAEKLELEKEELEAKLKWYEEQFRLSQKRQFGASSEQTTGQLSLFNEIEDTSNKDVEEPTIETITYKRKKKTGQRDQKLEDLPTETIEYRLSEKEQVCSCCDGNLHEMSTEVRREIEIVPAQTKVKKHVRYIYSCRQCERNELKTPIQVAKSPQPVYPGSLASPSAIAYLMSQKYVDGMPLYRQEKALERLGLSLSRQTMSNWMIYGAEKWLSVIFGEMYQYLIKQDVLHADETTLQVLSEPGRKSSSNSYMWMFRTGVTHHPVVLFDYQQTRASKHPKQFLENFTGYLHVDGYAGYHAISNVRLVGCWAHARRNFKGALTALPETAKASRLTAQEGLSFCDQLYKVESQLKGVDSSERHQQRQKLSQPILNEFSDWLKAQTPKVLPKSSLGKAIKYCHSQWEKLEAFLLDGRLELDNNRAERAIKPFVIGRKNWLFSNTAKGARSSALIYSVVETAKENNLNPYAYLKYLFEELPNIDLTDSDTLKKYLPWSETIPEGCRIPSKK
nr:IS66 family transposase [Evansella cellulosilytica]